LANTRFTLIGKCVVFLVKMPDSMLRRVLKEMEQLSKVRKTIKKTKRKTKRKESKAAAKKRMEKVRSFRR
jgi:hypothetical protein|tara:strand:- start:1226 stop:1435 length:210 start_codon:yes stop_codon:yes gene_type:complete